MSRYTIREQRAHLIPSALVERTTEPQPTRRTPLPDVGEPTLGRLPSSARRYTPTTQPSMRVVVHDLRTHKPKLGSTQRPEQQRRQAPVHQRKPVRNIRHTHRLTLVGSGMLLMVLLYFLCTGSLAWWQGKNDDWTYGNPRTYHTDHRVGHGDERVPSHFIAMNLNRQIRIIEFPGNDPAKAKVYIGPVLQGKDQESAPVTLSFRDVNEDARPDMLILVRDIAVSVFINDVIKDVPQFRPAKPEESLYV